LVVSPWRCQPDRDILNSADISVSFMVESAACNIEPPPAERSDGVGFKVAPALDK
jgi:hypothetical protein